MAILNSRQAAIAIALIEAEGPISAGALGSRLGLSARVVRYNLPLVRRWFSTHGVCLSGERRNGLTLAADPPLRNQLARELAGLRPPLVLSPIERRRLLLFELFTHDLGLSDREIRALVSTSRATTNRDLASIEAWLREHNLFVQKRSRMRTVLVGREDDLRHACVSLILETISETALLDLCLWGRTPSDRSEEVKHPVQRLVLDRISGWGLHEAWRFISLIERELRVTFPDSDHLSLCLYWAVTVQRVRAGHSVTLPEGQISAQERQPEHCAVEQACHLLHRETGLRLSPSEVAQLTLEVFASSRQPATGWERTVPEAAVVDREFVDMARRLAGDIGSRVDADLTHAEVVSRLAEHLSRTVTRARHGLPIRNPLTNEVQQAYPDLWRATDEAVKALCAELGVPLPAEEVAFITMYMGMALELKRRLERRVGRRVVVVCPSGGVTAWMLVSRLKAEFPELDVVEVISLRYLSRIDRERADVIVSTADLKSSPLPVITVSPLMSEQDVEHIRHRLGIGD